MNVWIALLIKAHKVAECRVFEGKYASEHCKVWVEKQPSPHLWRVYELDPNYSSEGATLYVTPLVQ